jgi:chemotaxis protein methyltransferase CheR
VSDAECVAFLQWALPRLRLRWPGFRRVRRQVRKRLARRLRELGLRDLEDYRRVLERRPSEWGALDALCRISVSRFYRDRGVFEGLADAVLPELARAAARRGDAVRCWSVGCASGEEPYTLKILWETRLAPGFPGIRLRIRASDVDEALLRRAREGRYRESSLRELPAECRPAFRVEGGLYRVRRRYREGIEFHREDVRDALPEGPFHLVLCRNLVLTYFDEALQREVLERLAARMPPGSGLVVGSHETLPPGLPGFAVWAAAPGVYRRSVAGARRAAPSRCPGGAGPGARVRARGSRAAPDGSRSPGGRSPRLPR